MTYKSAERLEINMAASSSSSTRKRPLRPASQLVHGGTLRSQFGETSEAMFLTQGFVYETMEAA